MRMWSVAENAPDGCGVNGDLLCIYMEGRGAGEGKRAILSCFWAFYARKQHQTSVLNAFLKCICAPTGSLEPSWGGESACIACTQFLAFRYDAGPRAAPPPVLCGRVGGSARGERPARKAVVGSWKWLVEIRGLPCAHCRGNRYHVPLFPFCM